MPDVRDESTLREPRSGPPGASPPVAPRWVKVAVDALAAVAALIGAIYLGAWANGAAERWNAAGFITMKTNMALCLALSGGALLLLNGARAGGARRWVAIGAAALVALVGVLSLSQHLLRTDLGIDQLLAREAPGAPATVSPNRVGIPGSTSLALLGAGLLALAWGRRLAAYLALATCLLVLVPAVGFLYGIGPFYVRAGGIAWPTVLALLCAAAGLLLASGDAEGQIVLWRDDPGGALLRRLLLPTALIPLAVGYVRIQGEQGGLYDTPTGAGLFALLVIGLFSLFLWRTAGQLSATAAERWRAADALREREERLAVTLRSIGDAVIATDAAGRIEVLNTVAEGLTGWTAAEAAGRPLGEVFRILNEETRRPAANPVDRVLREGVVVGLANHTILVSRGGAERPVADSAAPIRDADGRVSGVVLVFRDQSEDRRAQAALREADRRKSEFLGVLSHELRNPLAPIRNGIYLLDHAAPGSAQSVRAREVIRRQTDHLTRLVDDLLDVTRIERGKIELRRTRLDLTQVVRRTCEDYHGTFAARRLELRVDADGPAWVDGDETRIAQVVGNLLQNAAKFSREGGVVEVRVETAGGAVEVRVKDGGEGMRPELVAHVFEPFVQADGGLARTRGGLGLGLALVKGLVELHGGSVRAASDGPDRGAEFAFRLPLAPSPERAAAAGEGGARRGGELEILVIEDNPDAAESLAEVLRMQGHRVRVATDGRSGIASARERRPDVVLCDIGLPDVDGYEIARTLRGDGTLRPVRLVALTGYAQPEDRARAEEAGFDAHLAKPPALDDVLAALGAP